MLVNMVYFEFFMFYSTTNFDGFCGFSSTLVLSENDIEMYKQLQHRNEKINALDM